MAYNMGPGVITGPVVNSGQVVASGMGPGMASMTSGAVMASNVAAAGRLGGQAGGGMVVNGSGMNGGGVVMRGASVGGVAMGSGMATGPVMATGAGMGVAGGRGGAVVLPAPNPYPGSGGAVVLPAPDPCGCGPGASAGDCAGACGGMETMCCEAEGATTSVQWVHMSSGGSYAPVMSYQFVGDGAGTYEREVVTTYYGWKVRKCCLGLLGLLILAGLLYLLSTLLGEDPAPAPSVPPPIVIITTPTPSPAPEVPRPTPAPAPPPPPPPPPVLPAKTCLIFGDPHVKTFDGIRADYYTPGEYWLVRSQTVHIQGKYLPTRMTNGLSVTKEIGIGGPFIKNHKLVIGVDQVTWDGTAVMTDFNALGTSWNNPDPPISIVYNNQGKIMQKSRAGKALHVVHIHLPLGVTLEINRWSEPSEGKYVNTRLTMSPQPEQDGHCGNFNNNGQDDTRVSVRARVGKNGVPEDQLIFPGPKTPINPSHRPDLNDCPEGKLNEAMTKCRAAEQTTFPSKACLVDTCLGGMAPHAV